MKIRLTFLIEYFKWHKKNKFIVLTKNAIIEYNKFSWKIIMNQHEILNIENLVNSDLKKYYGSNITSCSDDLFDRLRRYKKVVFSLPIKNELKNVLESTNYNKEDYKSILLQSELYPQENLLLIQKNNITLIFNPTSAHYHILDKDFNFIYAITELNNHFNNSFVLETNEHIFNNKNLKYMIINKETKKEEAMINYQMHEDSEMYYFETKIYHALKEIHAMNYNFSSENINVELKESDIKNFIFDSRLNLKEVILHLDVSEKLNITNVVKVNLYSQFLDNIREPVALLELGTDDRISFFTQDVFDKYMDIFKKVALDRKSYYDNEKNFKKILHNTYCLHAFENKVHRYCKQYKHLNLPTNIWQVHTLLSILVFSKIIKENINSIINQEYIDEYKNKRKIVNNIKII